MRNTTTTIYLNLCFCLACCLWVVQPANAQEQATWIWYPGDYEIWLSNQMQNRRTERGAFLPPFWRLYSHYALVDFQKEYHLSSPEEIEIYVEGEYNVKIDSKLIHGRPTRLTLPAGDHNINLKVFNQTHVPAIYIKGKTISSDTSWQVTYEDKEWIDESGKVSDKSSTVWVNAGSWDFDEPTDLPSAFQMEIQPIPAQTVAQNGQQWLIDFGKETFGFVKFHHLQGKGKLSLYYGESKEEAQATETCETLDHLTIDQPDAADYVLEGSRAFRYVQVQADPGIQFDSVSMLYEYLPLDYRGQFRCSDERINQIWDIAAYTLHLNTREFFIDGIKRDRWIWSGDAYQSYLMNYYLFFDNPSVKRTLLALRGKNPVSSHINTILDYTFYWFIGIYDYYLYSGDKSFIQQIYPQMVSMMDFCLGRLNDNGMVEGLSGDWVFIDWAPMSKQGEVSFEQLLFCRSLETMALCADLAGDSENVSRYQSMASSLKTKILNTFWSDEKQALLHNRVEGKLSDDVTRYANMFAIFFEYLDDEKEQAIKEHVLLNDSVQKITTPYMRFYELEALCAMGEQELVLQEIRDYWGGMLQLGATSFWEKYDPTEEGAEHYAMYGRPFGKSLCHAWGASPIYLFGKYYMGVHPLSAGYEEYSVEPVLGGLDWMEGAVPTPQGDIFVYCSGKEIKIKAEAGKGTLRFQSRSKPSCASASIQSKGDNTYEMTIAPGQEYVVKYQQVKSRGR